MSTSELKNLLYEKRDGVATITLNRPKVLNVLNEESIEELEKTIEDCKKDDSIRVIVITGAGDRAFCVGADIREFEGVSPIGARNFSIRRQDLMGDIEKIPKPVIAKINGFCLGLGIELAMACDFRIASEKSRFGQPEINLAIIPGSGGTYRLSRLIGEAKAMEMILLGDQIDANEAYRLNLVNKVVPEGELDDATEELVRNLLEKSVPVLGMAKLAVNKGTEMDLDSALHYEARCFGESFSTEDHLEGVKAFIEKRKPEFKHR